jgi:hypothetical protein
MEIDRKKLVWNNPQQIRVIDAKKVPKLIMDRFAKMVVREKTPIEGKAK